MWSRLTRHFTTFTKANECAIRFASATGSLLC